MYYHGMDYGGLLFIILLLISLFIYFFPFIIANQRRVLKLWTIFIINLFIGWSVVGWLVALFLALSYDRKNTKKCPYCLSRIDENAKKCSHCGEWVVKDESHKTED